MRRREFIARCGATAAWPCGARAQQRDGMRTIGVLTGRSEDAELREWISALKQRLEQLGWRDERTFRVRLWGGEVHGAAAQAAALVASAPHVIIAIGNPSVTALRKETRNIPVIFAQVGDPVGSGFVASLARPGGNVTGFMHYEPAMGGKWLQLLKEVAPRVSRTLMLLLPEVRANVEFVRAAEAAGAASGIAVSSAGIHSVGDINRAISAFAGEPNGGLIALPNPVSGAHRELIGELATYHQMPSLGTFSYMAASGMLASYGIDVPNLYRRIADYVDRILKGERPAELPVQLPTKYELVINLKTATRLGLTVPPTLLTRADKVIE
jgi:putative tryptophan/tyrosine transport system substrate-binding protein